MIEIPTEVRRIILSFLSVEDLMRCKHVNKEFNKYVKSNMFKCARNTIKNWSPVLSNILESTTGDYWLYGNALTEIFRSANLISISHGLNLVLEIQKADDIRSLYNTLNKLYSKGFGGDYSGWGFVFRIPTANKNIVCVYFIQSGGVFHEYINRSAHYMLCPIRMESRLKLGFKNRFYVEMFSTTQNLIAQIESNEQSGFDSLII
jgi:hypothetical protein